MNRTSLTVYIAAALSAVFMLWPGSGISAEPLPCEILRRESVIEFDSEGAYVISELMFIKKTGSAPGPEFVSDVVDSGREELRDVRAVIFTDLGGVISESEAAGPLHHLKDMAGAAGAGKKKLELDLASLETNTVLRFSYTIASTAGEPVFSRDIRLGSEYRTYERLLRISFPKETGVFFEHSGNWSGISPSRKESEGRIVLEWSSDGIEPAGDAYSPVLAAALPGDWERSLRHMEAALKAEGRAGKPWYEIYDKRSIGRFPHRIINAGNGRHTKGVSFFKPADDFVLQSEESVSVVVKILYDPFSREIFWDIDVSLPISPEELPSSAKCIRIIRDAIDSICDEDVGVKPAGDLIFIRGKGRLSLVLSLRSAFKGTSPFFVNTGGAFVRKIFGEKKTEGLSGTVSLHIYEKIEDGEFFSCIKKRSIIPRAITFMK